MCPVSKFERLLTLQTPKGDLTFSETLQFDDTSVCA